MFKKDIFLEGPTIYLRGLSEHDIIGDYSLWLNDKEITKYNSHGRFPMTIEKLSNFVRMSSKSNSALVMAIVSSDNDKHIGNISLQSINWVDRNAEIAFLLGEKAFWAKV